MESLQKRIVNESEETSSKVICLPRMPNRTTLHAAPGNNLQKFGELYGSSDGMRQLYTMLERVAPTEATVFVIGESGTGKELVAKTVHQMSTRRNEPFLALN